MVDVKKLVVGFLVLATLASSLAFLFSTYAPTVALSPDAANANPAFQNPPPPPDNVFVEPVPNTAYAGNANIVAASGDQTTAPPTSNLTDSLTHNVLQTVIETNPQGPYDANGQISITPPDVNVLLQNVPNDPAMKKIKVPDWEADAAAIPFAVIEHPHEDDVNRYSAALQNIFETYFIQNDVIHFAATDGTDFDRLSGILNNALDALKAAPVPAQFVAFHKSAAKTLFYLHSALELTKIIPDDPMKAALIFSAQEKNYNVMLADLQNEFLKIKLSGVFSESREPTGFLAAANFILGIQTAHAFYPTWDFPSFSTFIKSIADDIKNFIKDGLLEALKQRVVKTVLNQTLNWVKGGGTPLFITNWKGFLKDTANMIAGAAIQATLFRNVCQPFRPLLRTALLGGQSGLYGGYYSSCTLDRIVGNIRGFYNNFEAGGWLAYGSMLQGENNLFANFIDMNQFAASKSGEAQDAAKNQGVSSHGFLSVSTCPPGTVKDRGQCFNPTTTEFSDPQTVTPGSAVAGAINNAFFHAPASVTNTNQSWASLFLAFVSQVTDALISKGLSNLQSATGF